jgi:hypothetical protein
MGGGNETFIQCSLDVQYGLSPSKVTEICPVSRSKNLMRRIRHEYKELWTLVKMDLLFAIVAVLTNVFLTSFDSSL